MFSNTTVYWGKIFAYRALILKIMVCAMQGSDSTRNLERPRVLLDLFLPKHPSTSSKAANTQHTWIWHILQSCVISGLHSWKLEFDMRFSKMTIRKNTPHVCMPNYSLWHVLDRMKINGLQLCKMFSNDFRLSILQSKIHNQYCQLLSACSEGQFSQIFSVVDFVEFSLCLIL